MKLNYIFSQYFPNDLQEIDFLIHIKYFCLYFTFLWLKSLKLFSFEFIVYIDALFVWIIIIIWKICIKHLIFHLFKCFLYINICLVMKLHLLKIVGRVLSFFLSDCLHNNTNIFAIFPKLQLYHLLFFLHYWSLASNDVLMTFCFFFLCFFYQPFHLDIRMCLNKFPVFQSNLLFFTISSSN